MTAVLRFVAHELRKAAPAFLFFVAVFGISRVTLAMMLEEHHLTLGGTAVAVIGALIVAKAVLVVDALPFANAFATRALVYSVLWKSALYWLITLAFRYLEEIVRLARQRGGFLAANERLFEEISWPHFWAVQLWIAIAVLAYSLAREMTHAIGRDQVRRILFDPRKEE